MLPKSKKISREEFPQDFHSGYKYHSPGLLLLITKQTKQNLETKFSFIVSKKVSKNAIKRILIKRRGYNIIKDNIEHIKSGFLCVFHFKKGFKIPTNEEINNQVMYLLKKANILT